MATAYSRTWSSGKVTWYTKVKQADGSWKPVALRGVKTESQANKLAFEIEREQERLHHGLEAGALFRGSFAELCHWAHGVHFKHLRGARSDLYRIRQHAGDPEAKPRRLTWLGALEARKVTSAQLEKYFAELADTETSRGKPTTSSTINRVRAMFSSIFSVAVAHGVWAGDNPAAKTGARKVPKPKHDILAAHEIGPVLANVSTYWRGVFAVGLLAGLRKGEIFALRKRDIDLERRVLLVGRSHEHDTTKGGNSAPVPIHEQLVPYLVPWLATPGPLLFPDRAGKMRSPHTHLELKIRAAMVRAGIVEHYDHKCRRKLPDGKRCRHSERHPDKAPRHCPACGFKLWPAGHARPIRFHDTRHTLASHALMSGASTASVQRILRHSDPRLTLNTYGHLTAGHLGDELNRVHLPGLASPSEPQLLAPTASKSSEPQASACIAAPSPPPGHGAWVVRGAGLGHSGEGPAFMNRHQNSCEAFVEPTGIEPVTYALRMTRGCSPESPSVGQASQVVGTPHAGLITDSPRLLAVAPVPAGRGALVVRSPESTHQTPRSASPTGAGRFDNRAGICLGDSTAELLTVRQVAERLQLSTGWVYRRIEAGDIAHVRVGQNQIRVSATDLAGYLRRFPGIGAPEAPAAPRLAPQLRRREGRS